MPALGLVLVLALALRATGLTWGLPDSLNVDERFVVGLAKSLLQRLSTGGSLDPGVSSYGALPLYLLAAGTAAGTRIVSWLNLIVSLPFHSAPTLYVGRMISVLAAVGTVGIAAELGRSLHGRAVGLLSGLLLAICLLPVREAHFATVDSLLFCLIMLTLLAGVMVAARGTWISYVLVGVAAAMAAATKLTALVVLAPVFMAHAYRRWSIAEDQSGQPGTRMGAAIRALAGLPSLLRWGVVCGVVLITWLALNPYILLNPSTYFDLDNNASALTQWQVVRGDLRVLYTLQFENTPPYLYIVTNLLFWGMGPVLEIVAFAGVAYSGWKLLGSNFRPGRGEDAFSKSGFSDAYLLAWFLAYSLATGGWYAKFIRYALPLIPVLCIFASRLLVDLWNRNRPAARGLGVALTIAVLGATLVYTMGFRKIKLELTWAAC